MISRKKKSVGIGKMRGTVPRILFLTFLFRELSARRDEMLQSSAIIDTPPAPPLAKKRSWEKEALIIGGSAGAGTAIGALAMAPSGSGGAASALRAGSLPGG